jgi:hypothetical protein
MRTLASILPSSLACSLLLVGLSLSPAPARADDGVVLAHEDLELVPLNQVEKQLLFLRNAELFGRVNWQSKQLRKANQKLIALGHEKNPGEKTRELVKKIKALRGRLQPALREVKALLRERGVRDEALRRLKGFPLGPRRPQRYAHSLVTSVDGLEPKRKATLEALVSAVDGAQLALLTQKNWLEGGGQLQGRKQLIKGVKKQINRIERRFWQLIDVLLDPAEKQEVRKHLPHDLSKFDDVMGHVLRIPGLTPSQGARIQALRAEVESEATADQAEVRRVGVRLKSKTLPQDERKQLGSQARLLHLRLAELSHSAAVAGRAILTPAQWDSLQSIPPLVSPRDRRLDLKTLVRGMDLAPPQLAFLKALRQRLQSAKSDLQGDMRDIGRMSQDFGPDSPQMQSMAMMRMGVESKGQATLREAARELLLDGLSATQVTGWVVGLYGKQ